MNYSLGLKQKQANKKKIDDTRTQLQSYIELNTCFWGERKDYKKIPERLLKKIDSRKAPSRSLTSYIRGNSFLSLGVLFLIFTTGIQTNPTSCARSGYIYPKIWRLKTPIGELFGENALIANSSVAGGTYNIGSAIWSGTRARLTESSYWL